SQHEAQMLARRIQMQFPPGSQQRMPVQNDDFASGFARPFVQPFAQVEFLACEELMAESADLAKRRGLAKDERAGHPPPPSADSIPNAGGETRHRVTS